MNSKPHTVEIFTEVAPKYEFLNSLMTGGRDKHWRNTMLSACETALGKKPECSLDLATGTGDVARLMADRWPNAKIIGTDPTSAMLAMAKQKTTKKYLKIEWTEGVAEKIEAESNSADIITIAFGFRNISEGSRQEAIAEAYRVLKNGGVFAILELGVPTQKIFRGFYKQALKNIMPRFASFFGPRSAYDYLAQSILDFPSPDIVKKMLTKSGFLAFAPRPLTMGMCWLYIGKKPSSSDY